MGLAASALGRLGSGPPSRVTIIATSRVRATTKEAAEKYGWKRLAAVNSDNALNASRAIQEIIETVLMFADIFIFFATELCCAKRRRKIHGLVP